MEDDSEIGVGKELYEYQKRALHRIFDRLYDRKEPFNLLFQLPTGGGKTVIFSEIARKYIADTGKKVMILTHRIELLGQTSRMLETFTVRNKVITSEVKDLEDQDEYQCFVAMVETLNNRLNDDAFELQDVGLVIIDEAHYNSFGKLLKFFDGSTILGVTATPLSSNVTLPMNENYDELIVGESIQSLIDMKYLAKAKTFSYDLNLSSLNIGINGDYTVRSSEELYSDYTMQSQLLRAYQDNCRGKKTLIFNNGIKTSQQVCVTFEQAGLPIKHLDNKNTPAERREILKWFKHTPNAILTSVGILTTGFDEPTVEAIILNRATRSLTLYFQMIGRGSRILSNKEEFTVIDLGNNVARFGLWEAYINWDHIFRHPEMHLNSIRSDEEIQREFKYKMPQEIRDRFKKSADIDFDIVEAYELSIRMAERPKVVIEQSVDQHVRICIENAEDLWDAKELAALLKEEIEYRVRKYSHCLAKTTPSYVKWLQEEYKRKVYVRLIQEYQLVN
ncbi:MAG: DEAD/DEAH box helicase family protein [Flavobacteriales bacterium]|nr:DEAD/DEAH box helicase family protein [Flavobacteriales bacterium]